MGIEDVAIEIVGVDTDVPLRVIHRSFIHCLQASDRARYCVRMHQKTGIRILGVQV